MSKSAFMVISIVVLLNSIIVEAVRFYDDGYEDKDDLAADAYDDEL